MEDLEEFESLVKAKKDFENRLINQRMYPDVSEENCEMQIFFDDPTDSLDPYPDLILKIIDGEVVEELCWKDIPGLNSWDFFWQFKILGVDTPKKIFCQIIYFLDIYYTMPYNIGVRR